MLLWDLIEVGGYVVWDGLRWVGHKVTGQETDSERYERLKREEIALREQFKKMALTKGFAYLLQSAFGIDRYTVCGLRDGQIVVRISETAFQGLVTKLRPREIFVEYGRLFDEGRAADYIFLLPASIPVWVQTSSYAPDCHGVGVLQHVSHIYREERTPSHRFVLLS